MGKHQQYIKLAVITFIAVFGTGCATLDGPENPDDPYESFNRSIYSFNDTMDVYAFKPVSKGYKAVTHENIDKGITNFFSNLDDFVVVINDVFQLSFVQTVSDFSRLFVNTTIGVIGIFDVAHGIGLKKHNEDFGQTLGYWGVESGPYLVLPFIGPSSVRDGTGFLVDSYNFDLTFTQLDGSEEWIVLGVRFVDRRADLLKATNVLDEVAPDRYAFIRDASIQRREYLINNGVAPTDNNDDESLFEDDLFTDDIIRK